MSLHCMSEWKRCVFDLFLAPEPVDFRSDGGGCVSGWYQKINAPLHSEYHKHILFQLKYLQHRIADLKWIFRHYLLALQSFQTQTVQIHFSSVKQQIYDDCSHFFLHWMRIWREAPIITKKHHNIIIQNLNLHVIFMYTTVQKFGLCTFFLK